MAVVVVVVVVVLLGAMVGQKQNKKSSSCIGRIISFPKLSSHHENPTASPVLAVGCDASCKSGHAVVIPVNHKCIEHFFVSLAI
jgi:hypothetical protein